MERTAARPSDQVGVGANAITKEGGDDRPQFRVLTDAQITMLYRGVLDCLERTGVEVLSEEAQALLVKAGARVEGSRVRIPPYIIEEALAAAPRRFSIWGRDPNRRLLMTPGRVHFGPGPSCTYFVDPQIWQRRRARREDPGLTAKVCDALENIDYVMGLALPEDVPAELAPVYEFAAMVANTGKPIVAWAYTLDNTRDIYRIAAEAIGNEGALRERPIYAFYALSQAPLIHTGPELTNVMWCADHGIPVVYHGGGTAGVSSPVTGAGTLVISLAAALSGLAMIQLKKQGAPVCLGGVPAPMDPASGRPSYGAPELSLYSVAMAEVAHYLGLPFMGNAGASECKVLDLQGAVESTMQVCFSLLSGTAMPHGVGFLDCTDIGSLEMLVMTDEIIGMARRFMRGIEISDETMMLDLIDRIGPGGEYISLRETAKQFRQEIWMPKLLNRNPWSQWAAQGKPTVHERIRERLLNILTNHRPLPLPEGVSDRIMAILEEAEARTQ
jgi:trimethylamine--corrinoid protein Co-methyltransferase